MDSRIVFVSANARGDGFGQDAFGRDIEKDTKRMRAVGGELPRGMFANYVVIRYADGSEHVEGTLQARAPGGRRHFADSSEQATQTRLIKWSNRILREIAQELDGRSKRLHLN